MIGEGRGFILYVCGSTEKMSRNRFFRWILKYGFVTATKLGIRNEFFVASTKNFAAATNRFVDRNKHFVVTKYFFYPYFNKCMSLLV